MDNGEASYISCEQNSLSAEFALRTSLGLWWGYLNGAYITCLLLQLQVAIGSIASSSLDLRKETHAAAIVGLPGLALLKESSRSAILFCSGKSHS